MGRKQMMGASLEELEKAGLQLMPPIAEAFSGASKALARIDVRGPFLDDGPFLWNSPASSFESLSEEMVSATRKSGEVLDEVATSMVRTARDFARTDVEIAAAFKRAGGTL